LPGRHREAPSGRLRGQDSVGHVVAVQVEFVRQRFCETGFSLDKLKV
jgi:hypothetical protein